MGQQIDYAKLAKQHGGAVVDAPGPVDYGAMAADEGAESAPPKEGVGFIKKAWEYANPVAAAQAFGRAVIPEAVGRAIGADDAHASGYGPINTIKNIGTAQEQVFNEAKKAYEDGDYTSAAIKALFYAMPLVGPAFNDMGNDMREGRTADALGGAVGLAGSIVAPTAAKALVGPAQRVATRVADAADASATAKTVDTMVPKIGLNKRKFGAMAEQVAPRVARETTAITRGGMLEQAATKLDDANAALEAAYDAVPTRRTYATQPIKDGINAAIRNLSVAGTGGTIEPATRAARLASLKQALKEVESLGGVTNLQNLRKLRQSWDEGAKAVFTPDIAADAFKLKSGGHGWADARTVLGDYIGSKHPELKPLNADVSLWIKASDVMQAAEDIERVRPTVGRSIMARGLGAAAGGASAGVTGAVTGAVAGPVIERVLANIQPAMKMLAARHLADLADALRSGNQARATKLLTTLGKLAPAAAVTNAAREGSVLPMPRAAEVVPQERQ